MRFDIEKNRADFEPDPEIGNDEREALGCPADWQWIGLEDLAIRIKARRLEIEHQKHEINGQPNYKWQGILQMIDADLYCYRPDLYES